jgi:hypothetical protein
MSLLTTLKTVSFLFRGRYGAIEYRRFISFLYLPFVFQTGTFLFLGGITAYPASPARRRGNVPHRIHYGRLQPRLTPEKLEALEGLKPEASTPTMSDASVVVPDRKHLRILSSRVEGVLEANLRRVVRYPLHV